MINLRKGKARRPELTEAEKDAISDKWFPRLHGCFAYTATIFYLTARRDLFGVPPEMFFILYSWFFRVILLQVGTMVAITCGVAIGWFFRFRFHGPMRPIAFCLGTSRDYRLRYYKPYLVPLGFILISELALWVFW